MRWRERERERDNAYRRRRRAKVKERERRAAKWRRIKKIEGGDEQEKWLARGKTKVPIALFEKKLKNPKREVFLRFGFYEMSLGLFIFLAIILKYKK